MEVGWVPLLLGAVTVPLFLIAIKLTDIRDELRRIGNPTKET